ncbi:hypothetical protein HMI54_010803 [Coelomomyces lativittatus]|nr:hypothetical protein HMI54_010803 [Coelomomyces lativittatus]
MFDYLTITAVIDDRIFCVHGGDEISFLILKTLGLSQQLISLDQIRVLDRFTDQPDAPLTELLWSDPSQDQEKEGFSLNTARYAKQFDLKSDLVEEQVAFSAKTPS